MRKFVCINIVVPFIVGLFIYVLFKTPLPIFRFFTDRTNPLLSLNGFPDVIKYCITNHFADMLWVYSLSASLYLVTSKALFSGGVAITAVIIFEALQGFDFVAGTGDVFDIIFSLCSVTIFILFYGGINMKKLTKHLLVLLVLAVFATSAIASGTDGEDTPVKGTPDSTESKKAEVKEEKFKLKDTAVFKGLSITANSVERNEGSEYNKPAEGKTFVGVKFTIENTSSEEQTISSMLLFEAYADDIKCDYSIGASMAFKEGTLDGSLSPGKKMVGYYAIEVPTGTKKLDLEVKSDWLSNSKAKFEFEVPAK